MDSDSDIVVHDKLLKNAGGYLPLMVALCPRLTKQELQGHVTGKTQYCQLLTVRVSGLTDQTYLASKKCVWTRYQVTGHTS